jgi:DNA-binding CsgD family transcriptional regulator
VSTYKTRLMAKLGVDSLVGLIKLGMSVDQDEG